MSVTTALAIAAAIVAVIALIQERSLSAVAVLLVALAVLIPRL